MSHPEEEVGEGIVGEPPPPTVPCSICTTPFPGTGETLTPTGGEDEEWDPNWKSLIFQALCVHLNVKQVLDSAVGNNHLDSALKVFRLCPQCISYSWRLVVLDQNLTTIMTEIDALVGDFRHIISTASTSITNRREISASTNSVGVGELQNKDLEGVAYIQQFLTGVAENAALYPAEPEAEKELHKSKDGEEEEQKASSVGETVPDSTSEALLIQKDGAVNIQFIQNGATGTYPLQYDMDVMFSSTNTNNNLIGSEDPEWVGEELHNSGEEQDDDEDGQMEYLYQDIGVQENVTIESRAVSPSPPYSPISVGSPSDEQLIVKPEPHPINRPRRRYNQLLNDNLFLLKMDFEPQFCPPVKKAKLEDNVEPEKHRGRGRPKMASNFQKAALKTVTKGPRGRPRKDLATATKTSKTKLKQVPPKTRKKKSIKICQKMLARLPAHDVEGYEGMCRLGVPFNRISIKLQHCNAGNVTVAGSSQAPDVRECSVRVEYYDELFDKVFRPLPNAKDGGLNSSRSPSKSATSSDSTRKRIISRRTKTVLRERKSRNCKSRSYVDNETLLSVINPESELCPEKEVARGERAEEEQPEPLIQEEVEISPEPDYFLAPPNSGAFLVPDVEIDFEIGHVETAAQDTLIFAMLTPPQPENCPKQKTIDFQLRIQNNEPISSPSTEDDEEENEHPPQLSPTDESMNEDEGSGNGGMPPILLPYHTSQSQLPLSIS